jgi:hypothetical protein
LYPVLVFYAKKNLATLCFSEMTDFYRGSDFVAASDRDRLRTRNEDFRGYTTLGGVREWSKK